MGFGVRHRPVGVYSLSPFFHVVFFRTLVYGLCSGRSRRDPWLTVVDKFVLSVRYLGKTSVEYRLLSSSSDFFCFQNLRM